MLHFFTTTPEHSCVSSVRFRPISYNKRHLPSCNVHDPLKCPHHVTFKSLNFVKDAPSGSYTFSGRQPVLLLQKIRGEPEFLFNGSPSRKAQPTVLSRFSDNSVWKKPFAALRFSFRLQTLCRRGSNKMPPKWYDDVFVAKPPLVTDIGTSNKAKIQTHTWTRSATSTTEGAPEHPLTPLITSIPCSVFRHSIGCISVDNFMTFRNVYRVRSQPCPPSDGRTDVYHCWYPTNWTPTTKHQRVPPSKNGFPFPAKRKLTNPRHASGWSGIQWRNRKMNSTIIRDELQFPQ